MKKIMIKEVEQKIPIRNDSILKAPLVTFDGFSSNTLGKSIFILSGNLEGVGLAKRLRALKFDIGGFIDSRFSDEVYGFPLVANDLTKFLKSNQMKDSILIIATKDRVWKKKSFEEAELAGYVRGVNLFTPLDLCPYFPTIEIAGKCNLVCKTCDMGLPSANKGRGYMSAQVFEENLKKLLEEIPFLNSIALYTWGEPLLNPQIAEIIRISNLYGVSTEVSTNLEYHKYLDEFVLAEPSQIVAPCAGIGEKYERGRTGGTWENYLNGLKRISKLKKENNLNISLRIMYHVYRDNYQQDLDEINSIAKDLGFNVIPILAHIFPGQVLKYATSGIDVPQEMREAEQNLVYGIDEQLGFAKSKVSLPCHIIQAFPTISWDGRVLHCCNMQRPYVTNRLFTEAPLSEFIRERNNSVFCTRCMNAGVHRFFDVNIKFEDTATGREIVRL